MASESEQNLLTRAVAGDKPALERLLLAYAERLERRVARRLPRSLRSVIDSEDILQEAFVDAFRSISSFRVQGRFAFYRWLTTIAEHRLQDAVKAHRAAKRGGGRTPQNVPANLWYESVDELIEVLGSARHTPSRSAARHEAEIAVQTGLASLKEDYRRAIELRHVQGLSVAEAAEAMQRTPHAVKNLCRRGLKELHVLLGRSSSFFSRR